MKLLVIEDDQNTSELLSAKLSAHRYAVDAIADGSDGLELASQWNYDLIVLDVLLPTLNGVEVCRRLRARNCQTPILMLTTKDANEDIVAGLDAGADDYVAKSCDDSQLLARVRALLRRGVNTTSSPVLTWGLLSLDPASAQVAYGQKSIALRPKEYMLLELFLRNPRHIFSRSAIIDHLWSMEETPVEGSVTNLIKDLRQRLKAAGMDAAFIETVYGLGYRLNAPGQESALAGDRTVREQRGRAAIEQIAAQFRHSLEQRLNGLEAVERSIQAGSFSLQQQQAIRAEVHKLAGGLGTFGYSRASEIAQAIEQLLEPNENEEMASANQFAQLLNELKQELDLKA
ncbi:MAG: response regulator [Leptolyngbyaceae cyanobacterium SL_7_1]|nr:response regulator [Leptolyngbyaceae cyanobacterium SL_7_1]